MMPDELHWLQEWYQAQCDGGWEQAMSTINRDDRSNDWIRLEVKDSRFFGNGDPSKLGAILAAFRR